MSSRRSRLLFQFEVTVFINFVVSVVSVDGRSSGCIVSTIGGGLGTGCVIVASSVCSGVLAAAMGCWEDVSVVMAD